MNMRKLKRAINRLTPEGRHLVIGVPFLWLFLFFMLPFFIVLKISFAEADVAIPPYTEIYSYAEQKLEIILNLGNYLFLTEDELYLSAYLGSLKMAAISTIVCLLIGYPMAYAMARAKKESQTTLLLQICTAVSLLLGALLAWLLANSITRPLRHAETIAEAIADMDLSGKAQDHYAADETGRLLNALDTMRGALQHTLQQVQILVQQ